jgi:hypothetical protein
MKGKEEGVNITYIRLEIKEEEPAPEGKKGSLP